MDRELRILILEDSAKDAELVERELHKGGIAFAARHAETRDAFVRQLEEFQPDLVLSDYTIPSFDGLAALKLLRERSPEVPFVFVSGTIGEERAIEALKLGAIDYVLKDHLLRLVPVVQRALQEAEERAELKKLEEQFRQAQKMEAVGHLAGGLAHDFNNVLTVISVNAQLVLPKMHQDDPFRRNIEDIRKAVERAAALTHQLLAFSRRQIIAPRVLQLNDIVTGVDRMLRRVIGEDIELATVLEPSLGHVKVDPGQIEQVIMNLAVNARDAMPNGGKLTIETENADIDPAYARKRVSVQPGPHVMLAVSDNGQGMDEATRARIFEPLFTTKAAGKGTGLGLATVYGIVKQHGGHIWVYSEPGKGASFKIYLPLAAGPVEPAAPAEKRETVRGGSETLLVVEDDEQVRALICRILTEYGYAALAASCGEEALEIYRRHEGPVPLLVTDVVLPQMNGEELARQLTVLRPGIKTLYLSGYANNAVTRHGILRQGLAFLQKPFTPEALARKVREVLDS